MPIGSISVTLKITSKGRVLTPDTSLTIYERAILDYIDKRGHGVLRSVYPIRLFGTVGIGALQELISGGYIETES
jgi:hypothetical protein